MKNTNRRILAALVTLFILINAAACGVTKPEVDRDVKKLPSEDVIAKDASSSNANPTATTITATVESYLRDCAYAVYYHDAIDTREHTILSVSIGIDATASKKIDSLVRTYCDETRTSTIGVLEDTIANSNKNTQALANNIKLQEARIAYFAYLYKTQDITFSYFTPTYATANVIVNGDTAFAQVYERLDYQYVGCSDPTSELTEFNVGLMQIDGKWLIAEVASDDTFFVTFSTGGFDLASAIKDYDASLKREAIYASVDTPGEIGFASHNNAQMAAIGGLNYSYNKQSAANYALTYSTQSDNTATPSYKNTNFCWDPASCSLFASQCVWAGFGGSNTLADINAKHTMDASGTYTWWSTSSTWSNWASCSAVRSYITGSSSNLSEIGVTADLFYVPYDSASLTTGYVNDRSSSGTGSFSGTTKTVPYADLVGAVVQVKGSSGGSPVRFGHAIFINNATSGARSNIYYTAYNNCAKNKLLSTSYEGSSSTYDYCVIVPRTFRSGSSTNRLWANLQNAVSSGTTLSLASYASTSCATLVTKVIKPDGTVAATYSGANTSSWSGSHNFNVVGTWKVEVTSTSPSLATFTYVVRVV